MTEELEKEAESKAIETCPYNLNMPTYAQGFVNGAEFGYNKAKDYAKTIIQDLLSNSDEYARQRAIDFLKEK